MSKLSHYIESTGAIVLAIIWISPLLFAFWAAFHSTSDAVNFNNILTIQVNKYTYLKMHTFIL